MDFLSIISATRRVHPGGRADVHWDVNTPNMRQWYSFRDLSVVTDGAKLYGLSSGLGDVTIDRGAVQLNVLEGVIGFNLPPTCRPGGYMLGFSLEFYSRENNASALFSPNINLMLVVEDAGGGGASGGGPIVHSVQPSRCAIQRINTTRKLRFELLGSNFDQQDIRKACLVGPATSNRGIDLHVTDRSGESITVMGRLTDQQLAWLRPGPAEVVVGLGDGQLFGQVTLS